MSSGGGSGGGTNTVTQSTQIPQFEQDFAQSNQQLAQSLGQQPYPTYQGALVQGFAPQQYQGMNLAQGAASAYQPDLSTAEGLTYNGVNNGAAWLDQAGNIGPNYYGGVNALQNAAAGSSNVNTGMNIIGSALGGSPANAGVIQGYMSPYVSQALAPQVTALQTQLGQQQNAINAQATQAGAFGDARQGAEQALQNFYGNQSLSGLVGQGYNTAYSNALQTALGEQQLTGQLGTSYGNLGLGEQQAQSQIGSTLGNLGLNESQLQSQIGTSMGNLMLAGGQQMGNLGGLNQSLGITGANALFNTGQQQQQLGQQELNQAYQQYLNQVNWPFQMLNVQESALSNSPYNMVNATTLPQANMTAQGFGAGVGALGSLASLLGGGGGNNAPFGGSAFPG